MQVQGKELKIALSQGKVFIDETFPYVWLYPQYGDLYAIATNGHCFFQHKFDFAAEIFQDPINLSLDNIKQIATVIDTKKMPVTITPVDDMLAIQGNGIINIKTKYAEYDIKSMIEALDNLTPIEKTIPKAGIHMPAESFTKIFKVFASIGNPNVQCLIKKDAQNEGCYLFTYGHTSIYCMGLMENSEANL